jgi:uncharacterized protein
LSITQVVQFKDIRLSEPCLVTGFVGAGIVGTIAVNQIIENLNLHQVGYLASKHIPPVAVFLEGKLRHPFRVYAGRGGRLVAVICEVPIGSSGFRQIADAIVDWAKKKSVREIVALDGIPVKGIPRTRRTFCAAERERCAELAKLGIQAIKKGYIGGLSGALLIGCLARGMPGLALLTPATVFIPDASGASQLVSALNKVYGLNVPTKSLEERGAEIRELLRDAAKQYKNAVESEQKQYTPGAMYA